VIAAVIITLDRLISDFLLNTIKTTISAKMSFETEVNPGEVKVFFKEPVAGRISFSEMGLKDEDLNFEGGFARIVFDFENIGEHHYYQVPTVELSYAQDAEGTHWQCDFNETTILDKNDNRGQSNVILLNRRKLAELEHHHKNAMVIHAEFTDKVRIVAGESAVNFFTESRV
jgi:hypothetical protein